MNLPTVLVLWQIKVACIAMLIPTSDELESTQIDPQAWACDLECFTQLLCVRLMNWAWRAARGCPYNGLASPAPGVCCFTHKKSPERKCIRSTRLMVVNPPRTAALFELQPRGWWPPGVWALSFTAEEWRKIKDTVLAFQGGVSEQVCHSKPTWLAGPLSLFHAH